MQNKPTTFCFDSLKPSGLLHTKSLVSPQNVTRLVRNKYSLLQTFIGLSLKRKGSGNLRPSRAPEKISCYENKKLLICFAENAQDKEVSVLLDWV
jgi:hypothetical protein